MRVKKVQENGSILVLFAMCFTLIMLALALSIDIGYITVMESRLQNTADATALAGASQIPNEGWLTGDENYDDDISAARDYTEVYADYNRVVDGVFYLDRNDENAVNGGVVVGYIEDPNDLSSPLLTESLSDYNSVQVEAKMTGDLNGPLGLFMGAVTGNDSVEMSVRSTATIEDRISGFTLKEDETLPMVPMAVHEDTWDESIDGFSDDDNYRVTNGVVTKGSDGIPEIVIQPWYPNLTIPGQDGNARTVYLSDTMTSAYSVSQILDGVTKDDLEGYNVDGLLLEDDGNGDMTKWLAGGNLIDSSWHAALNNIKGEKRIIALFNSLSLGSPPTAQCEVLDSLLNGTIQEEETCMVSMEYYEITGFRAVTILESKWMGIEKFRRIIVQPAQMNIPSAVIDSDAPHSRTIYSLSITR